MNKVYKTGHQMGQIPSIVIFFLLSFFPIVGMAVLGLGIWVCFGSIKQGLSIEFVILSSIYIVSVGIFLLIVGWMMISAGLVKYKISFDGVYAKYPLTKLKLFKWDEFQEVSMCYAARTTRGEPRAIKVLCFVKKGERKNIYGRWKTDNIFKHRRVITINYSDELYEFVKSVCPYRVLDIRKTWEIKKFEK